MKPTSALWLAVMALGLSGCAPLAPDDEAPERESGPDERNDALPDHPLASCGEVPDGTVEDRVFYERSTVPWGAVCEPRVQRCACADGQWSCEGPLTETSCEVLCPEDATRVGGTDEAPMCECAAGYVMEGGRCVSACPPHSFWNAATGGCTCEPDYYADATGTACVHGDELCPLHSHYVPDAGGEPGCECDAGYVVNWDRDACVLPGEECPAGRPSMVVNDVVILCCPAEAEGVSYSSSTGPTCTCPEGQTYDSRSNSCE